MSGLDEVRAAYAQASNLYIDLFDDLTAIHEDDLALIEGHLGSCDGPVLDLGCGPGRLTAHLRALGVDATGIDIVPEFIDHAEATYPQGRYRLGSIADLDAEDASVGGAVAWYSLIHTPPDELGGVLDEVRRVMAPGARLVVGLFDGEALEPFAHKVTTAYRWPAEEFTERLRRAGFTPLECHRRPGVDQAGHRPHATIAAHARTR